MDYQNCIHCNRSVIFEVPERMGNPKKCECGYEPLTRKSQQAHGKCTLYCNKCQMFVEPCSFGGQDDLCPYHQQSAVDEDGATYQMYDEMDQNGEAY